LNLGPVYLVFAIMSLYFMIVASMGLAGVDGVPHPPELELGDGFFSNVGAVTVFMVGMIGWIFQIATFNIDGAPIWVRMPLSFIMLGTMTIVGIVIITNVVRAIGSIMPFTVYLGPPGRGGGEE
jgi:hypothetical protein